MTLQEKLKQFKEKINNFNEFNYDFKNLVAIELFDFIQENKLLKSLFDNRFEYLKRLATEKEFINIQNKLFEYINKILNLVDTQTIKQINQELSPYNKFINKLKSKKDKKIVSLLESVQEFKDKKNYYQLKYKDNYPHYITPEEISVFTHTYPIKKQYDFADYLLDKILPFINNDESISQKIKTESKRLSKLYNNYWHKFDQKIYRTPLKIHYKEFEDFFIFCVRMHPKNGYTLFHKLNGASKPNDAEFQKIKNNCLVVIDDLAESLNDIQTTETITKITDDEIPELKRILDAIYYRLRCESEPYRFYVPFIEFPEEIPRYKIPYWIVKLGEEWEVITKGSGKVSGEKPQEQEIDIKVKDKNKFLEFKKQIDNKYQKVKNKKPNKEINHNEKISYEYDSYGIPTGILKIKGSPNITFTKHPAKVIAFFYDIKEFDSEYKNYKHYNKYDQAVMKPITSNDFNKRIKKINDRVSRNTKHLIRKIIIKKELTPKQEPNLYKWNNKIEK